MKKILLYCLCISLLSFVSCNDNADKNNKKDKTEKKDKSDEMKASDVPAAVVSTFNTKYAGATDIEWKHAKEDGKPSLKAKFKINGIEKKAEFGEDGTFIKEKDD